MTASLECARVSACLHAWCVRLMGARPSVRLPAPVPIARRSRRQQRRWQWLRLPQISLLLFGAAGGPEVLGFAGRCGGVAVDRTEQHSMMWESATNLWKIMAEGGPWRARRLAQGGEAMADLESASLTRWRNRYSATAAAAMAVAAAAAVVTLWGAAIPPAAAGAPLRPRCPGRCHAEGHRTRRNAQTDHLPASQQQKEQQHPPTPAPQQQQQQLGPPCRQQHPAAAAAAAGHLLQRRTFATPRHATPRHATPRRATPRHATPRHASLVCMHPAAIGPGATRSGKSFVHKFYRPARIGALAASVDGSAGGPAGRPAASPRPESLRTAKSITTGSPKWGAYRYGLA
ncbi:hypothetical protein VOLCADRAFT_97652 [Volvox carteri f. nagariensis]|uniref:Uncharacterized protein n=1 Tax=Volvox carteri f. nagariensis TaxID=3068 RepID=D8UDA0_VOLCA|nr:uncharacterized protein VOLCADRAFT_97652 [Volvox carteri f. nagariensis]EFJ42272.1 hypothetical protein VOLCADRAFT_97652 [Volvox carteri f. nagariensis]|eukprot:XP_002956670.1 hypothetical protein VOLCADRAFT_97652 [Volvox carteri f. nagariensis]